MTRRERRYHSLKILRKMVAELGNITDAEKGVLERLKTYVDFNWNNHHHRKAVKLLDDELICDVCRGGGDSSGPYYCWRCKGTHIIIPTKKTTPCQSALP